MAVIKIKRKYNKFECAALLELYSARAALLPLPTHLRSPLLAAQHIIAVPTQWFKFRANNAHQNEAFKHFGFPIH